MSNPINLISIITFVAAIGLFLFTFVLMFTGGADRSQILRRRFVTLIGGLLCIVGVCGLPWVSLGSMETMINLNTQLGLQPLAMFKGIEDVPGYLIAFFHGTLLVSGLSPTAWSSLILMTAILLPAISGAFSILFLFIHLMVGRFNSPNAGNLFLLAQTLFTVFALLLLLLEWGSGSILSFGLSNQIATTLLVGAGVQSGYGLWVTLVALLVLLLGCIMDHYNYYGHINWVFVDPKN